MRAIWITAAVALATGCTGKGKDKPKGEPAVGTTAADAGVPADAAAAAPAYDGGLLPAMPVKLEGAARAEVEAFVARWLASQNEGSFATYQTFYGDRFHGVRRSGRVVKRFDREGWMKDRGAMFKRPMQVQSADLVAYAQGDRRQLFFTQTWAQGSYKDTGTKTMVVTGTGDTIRVVYEELLESKVQRPGAGAAAVAITDTTFGYDGAASVDTMRLARVTGGQIWLAITPREIGWVDAEIDEEVTEASSGQIAAAVVVGDLPPGDPLAALAGVAVTVLDADLTPACTGKLGTPTLRYAGTLDGADDRDDVKEKARTSHDLYVIAPLEAPCTGPFVRGAKAAALTAPDVTELPDRALRSLHTWYEGTQDGTWESAAAGKQGWVLVVVHTKDSCETQEAYAWTLHRAAQTGRTWKLEAADDGDGEDADLTVVDVDGDGELDAITRRGAHVGGTFTVWDPDLRTYWPAGLGCDGYDGDDEDEETVGD